jgi:hypothetical protein
MRKNCFALLFCLSTSLAFGQDSAVTIPVDTMSMYHPDSSLRIVNLNPFFTLHVDSTLTYPLQINKNPANYFWYLKNSPVGLRIHKDHGLLSFKADKAYFLSGKLKYDVNYKVMVGVQNLGDPEEKVDTAFTIVFYNTEIIPSRVKPTVNSTVWVDEGERIRFKILCDQGSFPIETILTLTSFPIQEYGAVQKCGEEFTWTPGYDIAKESDPNKEKPVTIQFIGTTKFGVKDTAIVRINVRDALNYPIALTEYRQVVKNMETYVLKLKYTFLQLDQKLKKNKKVRTGFDLTAASTSVTGTVLSTSDKDDSKRMGRILPSIGLALVPIKEAAAPNKAVDQNQAGLIRTNIKRLEYIIRDNQLIGDKDLEIGKKLQRLKDELKQVQLQLIDVPIEITNEMTEEELNQYFNSPRVNKKYRLNSRRK